MMAKTYLKFVHCMLTLKELGRFRSSIPVITQCGTGVHTATIFLFPYHSSYFSVSFHCAL